MGKYRLAKEMIESRDKHITALETEVKRLREAIETVEWARAPFAVRAAFCPWCGKTEGHGHRFDCMRQAALAPQGGDGEGEG